MYIVSPSPKSENQRPESEKENSESNSVNESSHLSRLHISFLAISLKPSPFSDLSSSVELLSLSFLKSVDHNTEFDFLVTDSEFSFSDSGLWFSDFTF